MNSLTPLTQPKQWALWAPVALAAGILCYFSLPETPTAQGVFAAGSAGLAGLAAGIFLRSRWLLYLLGMGVFWAMLGFTAAGLREQVVAAPALTEETRAIMLHGTVERVEDRGTAGRRILLNTVDLWRWPLSQTPRKVRVTLRGESEDFGPGDRIALRVVLSPPPRPVYPGGYDFARMAYFEQIGAVGFAVGKPRVLVKQEGATAALEAHRFRITHRIFTALEHHQPAAVTGIAAALLTGEAGRIPEEALVSLRASGLAHILSISGLHMVLVSSIVYVGLRALLALIPGIVLRYPVQKWAAIGAILAGGYYLLLAGMPVPAERAYIMTTLFFLAVLFERGHTPMRPVALAAMLLLLLRPESVLSPSFQMSFAAVIGLCAYFAGPAPTTPGPFARVGRALKHSVMASLVAGTATAPFALYHFGQYAVLGLLANLAVMPLATFLIMPAGVLALCAMPLGLEALPLQLMALGIQGMITVSDAVAALPFSTLNWPHMPSAALLLIVAGGLWLCLWPWRIGRAGLLPIALGGVLYALAPLPDILIDGKGKLYAVRDAEHGLLVPDRVRGRYARDYWGKALGLEEAVRFRDLPPEHPFAQCDAEECTAQIKNYRFYRGAGCSQPQPDIVVQTEAAAGPCAGRLLTLSPQDLAANGTHALFLQQQGIKLRQVEALRGRRGWTTP